MYEKPLYPTPDGYRRSAKNPNSNNSLKKEVQNLLAIKAARLQKVNDQNTVQPSDTPKISNQLLSRKQVKYKPQISEKAAKLIAMAIKSMLRSK